ncbi:MAG: cytochrome c biogenesis protein CcdA [Nitriliruptorales bacterium]
MPDTEGRRDLSPLGNSGPGAVRYVLLTAAVAVAGVAGYVGYVVFPRFDLPRAAGIGLLALAGATGFAAFFSPCSFPLLASLLARQTGADEPRGRRLRRAVVFATALSVGAVVFVVGLGALIALGGGGVAGAVTFTSTPGRIIRVVVGGLLIVLGLVQTERIGISFRAAEPAIHGFLKRQARLRRERPIVGNAVFGFGYLAAGFG